MVMVSYLQYQVQTEPILASKEAITESRWHEPWSEPVRLKINGWLAVALWSSGLFFVAPQIGENITVDKWFAQLSEPIVKTRLRLRDSAQQAFATDAVPRVSFGWDAPLSEPVRFKLRLREAIQQAEIFQSPPSPFVATGWFNWLAEPIRLRPGLRPSLQQFSATDTATIPVTRLIEWFSPFSEPVRQKIGLRPNLQQFLARPPRILPTPAITGVLSAAEELDTILFGLRAYNAVLSATASVQELKHSYSPVAIIENIKKLGNVSILASLPLTSSGSAVTAVASARVAIREV